MTESTTDTVETTEDNTERGTALRKAYTMANARLREQHRDEFDSLYSQCAEELGVTYTPKPKPEQRAEAQLREILFNFPELKDKIAE